MKGGKQLINSIYFLLLLSNEVYTWLFSKSNLCVISSIRDTKIDRAINKILYEVHGKNQVLVLDLDGRIQSIPPKWKLIKIKGIKEQIIWTQNLGKYINPRLKLIFISGFPTFLQEFRGKAAIKSASNIKIAAFLFSLLQDLSQKVQILVKTYQAGDQKPAFNFATKYYSQNVVQITNKDNTIDLKREDSRIQI